MVVDARPAAEAIKKWRDTADAISQWREKAALHGQENGVVRSNEGRSMMRRYEEYYTSDFPRVTWRVLADRTVRCGDGDEMSRGGPAFSYDGHRMIRWQDPGVQDEYDWMTDSYHTVRKPQLQQVQFDDARGARAFWEMVCRVQGVGVNGGRGADGQPAARGAMEARHTRLRSPEMWDMCLKATEFYDSLLLPHKRLPHKSACVM